MIYTLDSDILTLAAHGVTKVRFNIQQARVGNLVTLTEFVHVEALQGRFEFLRKAADGIQLAIAINRMRQTQDALKAYPILEFNDAACVQFDELRVTKLKIRRADLLIACIALAHDATLVTRNVKDFAKVPNLKIENWAT